MKQVLKVFAIMTVAGMALKLWPLALAVAGAYGLYRLFRYIGMRRYFTGAKFTQHKAEIQSIINEYNDISKYVQEMRDGGEFQIGASKSGVNSGLATFENISKFSYKRDRNTANFADAHVHDASLQVVRNASIEPIKYLAKYFDIESTEEKLQEVEALGESISRLANALENLQNREASISEGFAPPGFILKHYLKEFQAQIGLSLPELSVPYPVYKFQYLSAGGNSSQVTKVELNGPTIDALIEYLSEKVKFRKSAAGQRALMTLALREKIKSRDSFTCKYCNISVATEPHLLLEVDHIMPVSKGGLTCEENLQTLCWKCNRTKSNKVETS